jgi:signal transduction histidine kinase/ActR/RegA family two-component response regulator
MDTQELQSQQENKINKKGTSFIPWVLVVLLMLGLSISAGWFYGSLQERMFAERQVHLTELTIKISEALDISVQNIQSKAVSAKRVFLRMEPTDTDQMLTDLHDIVSIIDMEGGMVLAFNSRGRYYTSDGIQGHWENQEDLIAQDHIPVIREVTFDGVKSSYMGFFEPLDKPLEVGDERITNVAVLIPMDIMSKTFTISIFDDQCYTYLVNEDGRRLYRQTFSQTFIEDYNVLSSMEDAPFMMGGSIQELKDAVSERQSCSLEFKYQKTRYFVATVPLDNTDWTVLLFVPTEVLSANTSSLMTYVAFYFVGVAAVVTVISACLIYVVVKNRNDKKLIRQQEEANELLTEAAMEADRANKAKSEFLSHMSHDIRTPINGVVGMTNIALKNVEQPQRVTDCLHKIVGASNHLLTLINDVLDLSRIESGKVEIVNAPMDIRTLVDNCISIISGQILNRQLKFVREIGNFEHPYLLGDELHLRQVFINILGNAVKFTPDGGSITFKVEELEEKEGRASYRFTFRDTGIGMSEEFQQHIFESFSQEDGGSRTNYTGSGLGMAISKQFVDLMGGTITVESTIGVGSCFTVDLQFEINQQQSAQSDDSCDKVSVAGMKVLLVEDNELNLEIARELLEDEGVVVTTAEDGQQAVDCFTQSAPDTFDAILMDVMMPVMNGYEATKAIRASSHPQAEIIPIIAMTANAYAEDITEAIKAGMNAHVSKPIDMARLFRVLHQYKRGEETP